MDIYYDTRTLREFEGSYTGPMCQVVGCQQGENSERLEDGMLSKEVIVLRFYHGILFQTDYLI